MTGEYFSWLSHDDLYKKNKILIQISILKISLNKKLIIYSSYDLINQDGKFLYSVIPDLFHPASHLNKPLYPLFNGLINGCTLLIHTSLFKVSGLFNEALLSTQDYELWFRLFKNNSLHYIPESLVQTRLHQHQSTNLNLYRPDEENSLWINLLEQLTEEEILSISNNKMFFYFSSASFFRALGLLEAELFINQKIRDNHPSLLCKCKYLLLKFSRICNLSGIILVSPKKIKLTFSWGYGVIKKGGFDYFLKKLQTFF